MNSDRPDELPPSLPLASDLSPAALSPASALSPMSASGLPPGPAASSRVPAWLGASLLAGAALGAALAAISLPAPADAAGFAIEVSPGSQDFPLALPKPQAQGDTADAASQLWAIVRRDLEMSGYFRIVDPAAYIEQGKGVEPGTFSFGDWTVTGAAALAKTRTLPQPDGIRADVFIYDVGSGAKVNARGFIDKETNVRYLGHKIADEILKSLTGQPGIFGSRIAAVGNRNGHKEIYVMDVDGEGLVSVTNNQTINLSPAWSPDGGRLAFTSYKRNNADLYVKDLGSGVLRPISERPGVDSGAAWSPDGRKIALARTESGDSDVYVIDAATGADITRLTRGGGIDVAPAWSPDGSLIAFASERSGGSQVYVQPASGGEARRVTFQGGFNGDPVFSPDGSKIAFVGRDAHFDVFVVNLDGSGMIRITQGMGDNEDPSWSRDGRYLIFSSTRNGRSELWISTADGRHQSPVTTKSSGWSQPAWGP